MIGRRQPRPRCANKMARLASSLPHPMKVSPLLLANEATAQVTTLLGPRGSEAYKQNGGQWIKNLVPRPAITSPLPPRG